MYIHSLTEHFLLGLVSLIHLSFDLDLTVSVPILSLLHLSQAAEPSVKQSWKEIYLHVIQTKKYAKSQYSDIGLARKMGIKIKKLYITLGKWNPLNVVTDRPLKHGCININLACTTEPK